MAHNIDDFLEGLSDHAWDTLLAVSNDLQDSASPGRIESLDKFLGQLRNEIDGVNRRRDAIGQKVADIDALIPAIDACLRECPDALDVSLFRHLLLGQRAIWKGEIEELRPEGKLRKKYDTERKRDLLVNLRATVIELNARLAAAPRGGAARVASPAKAEGVGK